MQEELLNMLIPILSGGLAGYLTNTYAINMLFKEYTPLKIGGVIKKTKSEFIKEMADVVEQDIINPRNIQSCFQEEAFKRSLEDTIQDFFNQELAKVVGDQRIQDIQGYSQTEAAFKAQWQRYFESNQKNIQAQIEKALTHIQWHESQLVKQLTDTWALEGIQAAQNTNQIENWIQEAVEALASQSMAELLDIDKLKEAYSPENIEKWLAPIDTKELANHLLSGDIQGTLENYLSGEWTSKNIGDYLHIDAKAFSQKLDLNTLIEAFVENAQRQNPGTLENWLAEEGIQELYQQLWPIYKMKIQGLILWIQQNQSTLEPYLQQLLDETIAETRESRNMLSNSMLESKSKNLVQDMDVVEKLKDFLKNELENRQLFMALEDRLIKALQNIDLALYKDRLADLSADNLNQATGQIQQLLEEALVKFQGQSIQSMLTDSRKKALAALIQKEALQGLQEFLGNTAALSQSLSLLVSQAFTGFKEKTLKDFISPDQIAGLSEKAYQWLKTEGIASKNQGLQWIGMPENKEKVAKLIAEALAPVLETQIINIYQAKEADIKEKTIEEIISHWNENASIGSKVSEQLIGLFQKEIGQFTQGKISSIVTSNLEKLNEDELCDLVHEFIGKELGPITYFGAVLGALAGLGLGFMDGAAIPAQVGVYAVVGWATNFIALQMLFRPYNEKKWMSKIPGLKYLSQGYIIKNKNAFARNLGEVIEKELLAPESVAKLFNDYKQELSDTLLNHLTADEKARVIHILAKYEPELVKALNSWIYSYIADSSQWEKVIEKIQLGQLSSEKISQWIENQLINGLHTEQMQAVISKMTSEISLDWVGLLEKSIGHYMDKGILPVDQILQRINLDQWISADKIQSKLEALITGQALQDLAISKRPLSDFKWVENQLDAQMIQLPAKGIQWADNHQQTISAFFNQMIQGRLNFFQKIAFSSINGSLLLEKIVEKVITQRLPQLYTAHEAEVNAFLNQTSAQILQQYELGHGLKALDRQKIHETYIKYPLYQWLKQREPAIKTIITNVIAESTNVHKDMLQGEANRLIRKSLTLNGMSEKLRQDIQTSGQAMWQDISKNLSCQPQALELVKAQLIPRVSQFAGQWVTENFSEKSLTKWVEASALVTEIQVITQAQRQQIQAQIQYSLTEFGSYMIADMSWIQAETEKDIVSKTVQAGLEALGTHLSEIVNAMALKAITIREIEALEPRKIHQLFKNFAGRYFRKLEAYGLLGGIFGVQKFAGLVIGAVYFLKQGIKRFKK